MSHSYVKFGKTEIVRLREMERLYANAHPRQKAQRPILYRKRLVSHAGMIVYANGLYAKFCLGPKGRYHFVPFEALTDILPVTYTTPLRSGRAVRLGLTEWKALQFETANGWVFVADSRQHRFDILVPALKSAMGESWGRLYHPEEVLRSNILTGDAMVHRVIRVARCRESGPPGEHASMMNQRGASQP